ncbi:MAG: tetratricopeptide repeat protein [Isosphaeraceae bacterium]
MKRSGRWVLWLVVALVVFAGLGGAAVGFRDRLPGWLSPKSRPAAARAAYASQDWQRALDLAREGLKSNPADKEALRIYARASARLQNDRAAAAVYKDRLIGVPIEPEDYFLSGLMLARGGRPEMALEVWQKGAEMKPEFPEMLDHLARLSARLQRLDPALDAARRLARQPGWEARGLLLCGQLESMVENPKGGAAALNEGLKRDPAARGAPFPADYYRKLLARDLLQLGRAREAREPLEAVLAGNGDRGADQEAAWLLSRAYLQQGEIDLAATTHALASAYRATNPLEPEPSPYVGAARCDQCHSEICKSYARSRHALTFHRGRELLDLSLPDRPLADPDDANVTHAFVHEQDRVVEETRTPDRVFKIVVDYAFGVRGRYVTMVGRDSEETYRAARMSHFHSAEGTGWTPTFGNEPAIELAERIRGESVDVRDGVVRCVYCHVTRSGNFRHPPPESGIGPEAADAGIGCERCHGPGGNHIAAVKAGFTDVAIVTMPAANAAGITRQCGDCHTVDPPGEIEEAPEDPRYVRSPAVTLTFSRCYKESNGALSCVTCHDPHRDDLHVVAHHEAKCLSCHFDEGTRSGAAAKGASASHPGKGAVCKVNPRNGCLKCHMPKIPAPALRASLTDHYIRVRKEK